MKRPRVWRQQRIRVTIFVTNFRLSRPGAKAHAGEGRGDEAPFSPGGFPFFRWRGALRRTPMFSCSLDYQVFCFHLPRPGVLANNRSMRSDGLLKHLAICLVIAVVFYVTAFGWIQHRRTARGPWVADFRADAAGAPAHCSFRKRISAFPGTITFPAQYRSMVNQFLPHDCIRTG
jgi:hypothetical protein